uniref:K Homology domain-containing protein n=1 Tax=Globodera rostochiensis TaxID=31243 RepID=A0A914I4X1_GLORO
MHTAHPTSVIMPIDENLLRFPLIQVEAKIRVPDHLVGRLIGKGGNCLKKIIEDTQSHISISESRSQQEVHQYQTPELLDRIITIRGTSFNTVMAAEKHVQQKLRLFYEQDMNTSGGGAAGAGGQQLQQFCPTPVPPTGMLHPVDNIGSYIAPPGSVAGAPMISRADNAYHHPATVYGVAPQSFFVQNHPSATNFSLTTGQFAHNIAMPNLPNPVLVKSRVYVPSQIVGILIGSKGQAIKSIIAECGAIISIEGDRDRQKKFSCSNKFEQAATANEQQSVEKEEKGAVTSALDGNAEQSQQEQQQQERDQNVSDQQTAQAATSVETLVAEVVSATATAAGTDNNSEGEFAEKNAVTTTKQEEAEGGAETAAAATASVGASDAEGTTAAANTTIANNGTNAILQNTAVAAYAHQRPQGSTSPMERSVFIQGYDFQVSKAQYWVFQKVADTHNKHVDEISLACEAIVPSKVLGRIIGRGGHNVKQLQKSSGAHIKVPDDIRGNDKNCVEATVRIFGTYYAVQAVQQHFGTLITEAEWRESREQDERRSRHWDGGNSR